MRAVGTTVGAAAVLSTGTPARERDADRASDRAAATAPERVTVAHASGYTQLDPHRASVAAERDVTFAAYEGLVTHDASGRIVAELATDFQVAPRELTFQVRSGVRFHGGAEMTPADVAYSIRRLSQDDVGPANAVDGRFDPVEAVTTDGDAVTASLSAARGGMIAEFATSCAILRREWDRGRTDQNNYTEIEGTGPLALADYAGDRLLFERHDDHWGSIRPPETVRFLQLSDAGTRLDALETGEVDVAANLPVAAAAGADRVGGAELVTERAPSVPFAPMQPATEPFDSVQFRRALNLAVDAEAVIDGVLDGFGDPLGQPAPATFVGHDDGIDPYPHDPQAAETLVADSGYAGAEIELQVPQGFGGNLVEIGQALAGQIDTLSNVSCSLTTRDASDLLNGVLTTGPTEGPAFYLLAWTEWSLDAGGMARVLFASDGGVTEFQDDTVDGLLDQAAGATGEARAGHLRELSRYVHDRALWLFTWSDRQRHAIREDLSYRLRVDGRLDVPALGAEPPSLRVTSVDVPERVTAGETFTVTVTVENGGDATAEGELVVEVGNGGGVRELTVAAGDTETVEVPFSTSRSDAGERLTVQVGLGNELSVAREVDVVAPATTTPATTTRADDTTADGRTTAAGETTAPGETPAPGETTAPTDGTPDDGGDGGDENDGTDGGDVEFGDGSGTPGFGIVAAVAGLLGAAGLRRRGADDEE